MAQGEGGDDEDEAEFEPGNEDSDDDAFQADDDDDEEEDYIMLKGTIARHDGRLIYKGRLLSETFELKSKEPKIHWSCTHPTKTFADETNPPRTRTIDMEGTMGKNTVKLELTLSEQQQGTSANGNQKVAAKGKGNDEDDDGKMPSKPAAAASPSKQPVNVYTVYGKGTDGSGSFEILGQLDPNTAEHHTIPLECRKRTVSTAPAAVAAAAVVDEDDDDDADEGLDYDELIALHEDAGMSVEDLRKRYHSAAAETGNDDDNDAKPAAKKAKTKEDSDDDDEEYGF